MLLKAIYRRLNKTLQKRGFQFSRVKADFDDRPIDEFSIDRIVGAMSREIDSWLAGQELFLLGPPVASKEAITKFLAQWLQSPFRDQQGGSRLNNLIWLYMIARSFKPDVIIDSGTYRGASAWALALGCSSAQCYSFDINLSQLRLRLNGITYVEHDWTEFDFGPLVGKRVLVYFDDHIDQARRLIEAAERSCDLAIFDDDFPVTSYFAMAPSAAVLPKIEFCLDRQLADRQILHWIFNGVEHSWTVDRAYLDRAADQIDWTERLPNTSLITGVHQTPYRVVKVKLDG